MAFTPIYLKPFTWLDTETTGLDENENDIIEIAAVRLNLDGTESVSESKVKMERPDNAHPKALEVNGYTEEAWKDAEDPAVFWQKVADSGMLSDCIVAGQNVKFDTGFLNATFKRHGVTVKGKPYRVDYHVYDTCTLAIEHLYPWLSSVSLTPVCVALGIPVNNAHTALADVRLAMAVDKELKRATNAQQAEWARVIPARLEAWVMADKPKVWPPVN
jgi:DNA polymerase III subunit epsilon